MKKIICLLISFILVSLNSVSIANNQIFVENNKYGVKDSATNNIIIEPEFDKIEKIGYRIHKTYLNGKYGLIKYTDNRAKILLNNKYDEIIYDYRSQLIVKKDNKIGLYDFRAEKQISDIIYDEIKRVNNKYHKLKINGKYAIFNEEDHTISQDLYEDVRDGKLEPQHSQDNIQVKINGNWQYINKGKISKQFAKNTILKIVAYPMFVILSPIIVPLSLTFKK